MTETLETLAKRVNQVSVLSLVKFQSIAAQ